MEAPQTHGSRTQTATSTEPTYILRLRRHEEELPQPPEQEEERHVEWEEGVVNNEHMNKKKSKKCCIFHKPRPFDESETESDGCDSASDDEFSKKYPKFAVKKKTRKHHKEAKDHSSERCSGHGHNHSHGHSHDHSSH